MNEGYPRELRPARGGGARRVAIRPRAPSRAALSVGTPDGVLQVTLPKIYLAFTTYFGQRTEEHRAKLVTVILLTDERKLSMVWQTILPVPLRHMDYLDRTLIKQKPYLT